MSRLAILGAGPIGLEAALAFSSLGHEVTVYEQESRVGGHVRRWGHVRLFTPWEMNASPRARNALAAAGHELPEDGCPTGAELCEHLLEPLAEIVGARIRAGCEVLGLARAGLLKSEEIASPARAARPFRILVRDTEGERVETADLVLDCTGTWGNPRPTGEGGLAAPGEHEADAAGALIRFLPDFATQPERWAGRTLLIGSGHSALTAAVALSELETPERIDWSLRPESPAFEDEEDPLPARGRLDAAADQLIQGADPRFEVHPGTTVLEIAPRSDGWAVTLGGSQPTQVVVDRILSLTGGRPDTDLYRQLQVHQCYASEGPMKLAAALLGAGGGDCLAQTGHGAETLKNPEPGFFILGAKSYGLNSQFLLRVGWEQVDELVGLIGPAEVRATG